jgi:WD40 repeat protein
MLILKGHAGRVHSLAFSADGRTLASSGGRARSIWLWDLPADKPRAILRGHPSRVTALAFSRDGLLASADLQSTVILWDAAAAQERQSLQGPSFWYTGNFGLAFSPDGRILAASGVRQRPFGFGVRRWDVVTGDEKPFLMCDVGHVNSLAFAPDGVTLAAVYRDRTVRLWNLAAGRERLTLASRYDRDGDPVPNRTEIRSLAFSPDGHTLVTASGCSITLWDVDGGAVRASVAAHTRPVNRVAFTADGSRLATASSDQTVKLWDVGAGAGDVRERATFAWPIGKVYSLAFSPDGMTAAAGGDTDILVWDVDEAAGP